MVIYARGDRGWITCSKPRVSCSNIRMAATAAHRPSVSTHLDEYPPSRAE